MTHDRLQRGFVLEFDGHMFEFGTVSDYMEELMRRDVPVRVVDIEDRQVGERKVLVPPGVPKREGDELFRFCKGAGGE